MQNMTDKFDELKFFAQVKKRPGAFLGEVSFLSLRDQIFGMQYAFSFCCEECPLRYFRQFIKWYEKEIIRDFIGYACWWNHILYTCGNIDGLAFESFFRIFEQYLRNVHDVCLPEIP